MARKKHGIAGTTGKSNSLYILILYPRLKHFKTSWSYQTTKPQKWVLASSV